MILMDVHPVATDGGRQEVGAETPGQTWGRRFLLLQQHNYSASGRRVDPGGSLGHRVY